MALSIDDVSHLEDLIAEYYDWKGYLVKRNVKVGKLQHGGWEMELDIIAYDPHGRHVIHAEPSIDSHSWAIREKRFLKKFSAGRKYIFSDIFTWLDPSTPLEQVAVLVSHPKSRDSLAGGVIRSVDEFTAQVRKEVCECGIVSRNAISEQFPLLRMMQLSHMGYHRVV